MSSIAHKSSKSFAKRTAFILAAVLGALAAISPAAAAVVPFSDMDRGAIAMIIAFGTLLVAIVIEVWRLTLDRNSPVKNRFSHE